MHIPPTSTQKLRALKSLAMLCAGIALSSSSVQAFTWNGSVSSDLTLPANYSDGGAVPTFGATNGGGLSVINGNTGSAFTYTATQGSTIFNNGNLRVGPNGANGSTLTVNGGNLTIQSSGNSTLGFQGSGILNVTAGSLSILGSDATLFGNDQTATANISGGTVTIGNQFLFARDGGATTINLSGNGIFDVTNANGTQYGSANGNTLGTINLSGNSIFRQTGSNAINLTGNFNINFTLGSAAQFSLLGSSASSLQTLVSGGHFKINDVVSTNLSDYVFTGAPNGSSLGTIQLAAVPEPGTWGVIIGGALGLLIVQRRRKHLA